MTGRRATAVRHEITGVLTNRTGLRVGGWTSTWQADLAAARDGLGRLVIPGTSLAGAFKAHLAGLIAGTGTRYDEAALQGLFGWLDHGQQTGRVARIAVDDATCPDPVAVQVRSGVGIDRNTASAAATILYQHEVVPPGARFAFRLVASQTGPDDEGVEEALRLLLADLAAGRVEVGAARTRGLGGIELAEPSWQRVDLRRRDQVVAWLSGRAPTVDVRDVAGPSKTKAAGRVEFGIDFAAATPVLVAAATPGPIDATREHPVDSERPVDTVPLRDADGRLLLPGSSVKGVIRSHAERIVRTLKGIDPRETWLDQVNDARLTAVGELFGLVGDSTETAPGAGRQQTGRRGALSIHDCHGRVHEDRVTTHVAIDRWTGGAAENLLFSVQEPVRVDWEPLRISLDVTRLRRRARTSGAATGDGTVLTGDQAADCALALLLLVLRDLADGWLALGFGGTRGRGALEVRAVRVSTGLPGPWAQLDGRVLADLVDDPPPLVQKAFGTWRSVVAS